MPVIQQAGVNQMGPAINVPDRQRAHVEPGNETGVILSRITETTPPMPLNPASVSGVYNHTIFSPGGGGFAHVEYAVVLLDGDENGRDPHPDEWIAVAPAIIATATHWRLVIDTPSGNASPDDEWAIDVGNAFLVADVALWHVNGSRLVGRGTFSPERIADEETLTFTIDPGSVYHIESGGTMDWIVLGIAVRDRIFITFGDYDTGNSSLNRGVYTIKEIVDADNVIVYEPLEVGGGDFNIFLVQRSNA